MKQLKKDLQAVLNTLKKTEAKIEKVAKALVKIEKAPAKAKGKAKPAKKTAAKKAAAKKAPAKKAAAATATDKVLAIINRSKKGVDVPTLMKKTGFEEKKLRNIINRTFKLGKIKRAGRGIYVGA